MKKRKDGRYAKQVTVGIKDGKPIKKTVYGKTIKEVEKNYRDIMLLIDKGVVLDRNNITLAELWEEWFRIKKNNTIQEQSKDRYKRLYNIIIPTIGEMKVKKVTSYTVESLLEPYISSKKTATAKDILATLKSLFDYAIKNDIVYKNPCADLIVRHIPEKRRALTEFEKILIEKATIPEKENAFINILRYTGMRRNEVLALQKKDIDLNNSIIHIHKTLVVKNGKTVIQYYTKTESGVRTIPIFEPLFPVLREYIANKNNEDMLFLNQKGNYMNSQNVFDFMKKIKKTVGLSDDVTCHTFRHTFISECYEAGVDVIRLQQWVGHSDISTTLGIYTHLEKEKLENGNIMNEFYNRNRKSNGSQNTFNSRKIL
ncbi:tyrosine-type recombinase/integrase [Velocimicrobium porci]|uniref:Site-specific integrase n=1 Tax=Velocimicrobium porci TaxID=2606634 RepID=A0A6L5Y356_9FIRM|nr:site-specific integrase [Velocimicrobium porci]MSS64563.1 site-specific integrase [Velocimicrobium porci]